MSRIWKVCQSYTRNLIYICAVGEGWDHSLYCGDCRLGPMSRVLRNMVLLAPAYNNLHKEHSPYKPSSLVVSVTHWQCHNIIMGKKILLYKLASELVQQLEQPTLQARSKLQLMDANAVVVEWCLSELWWFERIILLASKWSIIQFIRCCSTSFP